MGKDYVINPDRFKNFFNELDTRRTLLTTVTDLNNKLFAHFNSLQETLNQKSLTLDAQIEKFKENTGTTLESLRTRESLIPEKEVRLAARVMQLKDSAISDIKSGNKLDAKKVTVSEMLRMWFRRMDSKGLMDYLLENKNKSVELEVEMAMAAEEAVDLLGFVLETVEEFVALKISGQKIGGLAPTRSACGILIQSAIPVLSGGKLPADCGASTSLKERAAMVLDRWKGVSGSGGVGMNSGEVIMFLTMVIGFGLKEKFDDEFLRGLILDVGSRRDMAKLAVALGSGDKMREIIEELVKRGKEIEAVYIATEAGLTDAFPAVQLLKSCLANCQKTPSKDASSQDVDKELNTTREIIKCIEDHKLESEFSMSSLKNRIAHLEKAKTVKKTGASATSTNRPPSNKRKRRERFGASSSSRPAKSSRIRQRSRQAPSVHPARYPTPYSYLNPSVYETQQATDPYAVGYGSQSHVGFASHEAGGGGQYGRAMNYKGYDYNAPAAASEAAYRM